MTPQLKLWSDMLKIGLPAGAEFGLMAVYLMIVYTVTRPFGAAAQAGFGIGMRIVQAMFMPVVALGFAVAPVAGQNFGARQAERVKAVFKTASMMAASFMFVAAVFCHLAPAALVRLFSADPGVIAVGDEYLRIISWNFVASGLVFVASSMFQAMGNTIPSLLASFSRVLIIAVPVLLLARTPGFELRWIWYLSVVAILMQLLIILLLLRREFRLRLDTMPAAALPDSAPATTG
jgi:Na+-driven multidrug efflux pump